VPTCSICGRDHAHPPEGDPYRSTTLASERLTDENWQAVPNGSVFRVDAEARLHLEALATD
jgi:predicted glutamine amidotransferase